MEGFMKENFNNCYEEVILKKAGCTKDKFLINSGGCKLNIISCNTKPCITSYHITTDSCGVVLSIYGFIINQFVYMLDKDCKKSTQIFITPFNECMYIPDKKSKLHSVSVAVENKHIKKLNEYTLMGYFTLMFFLKLSVPPSNDSINGGDAYLKKIDCVNTIDIEDYPICDDCCESNSGEVSGCCDESSEYCFTKTHVKCDDNPYMLKNDLMKYLSTYYHQNRL